MSEEKKAEIEIIQDMSLSYRIYLLSRNDFVFGVLIGVLSSLAIGYLTQIDLMLSNGAFSFSSLILRFALSLGGLLYLIYNHRKRTEAYETLLKKMSEKVQKLSEELKEEPSSE